LERYLALASNTEAVPVIIANKTDIPEDADAILDKISEVSGSIEVIPVCAFSARDVSKVRGLLGESETAVFAGASGVGKSTIVNAMCGEEVMHTGEVRENDDKGRHTTTFRYLIELSGGGVIIDTPGLREFGLWSEETDVSDMFEDIRQISENCRFSDCRHKTEPDCAVRQAVEDGEISSERLENYIKMCDELEELDRKKRWFKGKSTRYHRKKGEK
ncbi:MAG: ribosome small subunit-dependent GTPase A, partial [Candidatus Muiribacteriaceae bacterium]